MKIFKRLIKYIILTIISFVLIYLFLWGRLLIIRSNYFLMGELRKALGEEIYVGEFNTNFFNQFTLEKVVIREPQRFIPGLTSDRESNFVTIKRVVVRYNLIKLIGGKFKLAKSLSSIVLHSPRFLLTYRKDYLKDVKRPIWGSSDKKSKFPKIIITLKSGSFCLREKENQFPIIELDGVSAAISLKRYPQLNYYLAAYIKSQSQTSLICRGGYNLKTTYLDLNLAFKRLSLKDDINAFIRTYGIEFLGGTADGESSISLHLSSKMKNLRYSGKMGFLDAGIKVLQKGIVFRDVDAQFSFDNRRISISNLDFRALNSSFDIKGDITDYLTNIKYNLRGEGALNLRDLNILLKNTSPQRFSGEGQLKFSFLGTAMSPQITMDVNLIDLRSFNKFQAEKIRCHMKWDKDKIDFNMKSLNLYGGKFHGEGVMLLSSFPDERPFYERFTRDEIQRVLEGTEVNSNIQLVDIENINIPSFMGFSVGNVDVMARIFGKLYSPRLESRLILKEVDLAQSHFDMVEGLLSYRDAIFQLSMNFGEGGYRLSTQGNFDRRKMVIERMEIIARNQGRIEIKGDINLPPDESLALDLRAYNIEESDIRPITKYYSNLKGLFNFEGRIEGTISQPVISGDFFTDALSIREVPLKVKGDILYRDRLLSFKKIDVNENTVLKGVIDFKKSYPQFEIETEFQKGDLVDTAMIVGMPLKPDAVKGRLSGNLQIEGSSESFKVLSQIILLNPSIAGFSGDDASLSFKVINNQLILEELRWKKDSGTLYVEGEVGLKRDIKNRYSFNTRLNAFPIETEKISGDIYLEGEFNIGKKFEVIGNLNSGNLSHNGLMVGDFTSGIQIDKKNLVAGPFSFGDLIKGEIKLDIEEEGALSGYCEFLPRAIEDYYPVIGRKTLKGLNGMLAGRMVFDGRMDNIDIMGYLNLKEGVFQGIDFELNSRLNYSARAIGFQSISMKFSEDALVTGEGVIDFSKKEPFDLALNIKDIRASILKEILSSKDFEIDGLLMGKVDIQGKLDMLNLNFDLTAVNTQIGELKAEKIDSNFIITRKPESYFIDIKGLSINREESLVRITKGSNLLLGDGFVRFDLNSQLRNLNLGAISIFGEVRISGKADISEGFMGCDGILTMKKLWINQYGLKENKLRFVYQDKKASLIPLEDSDFLVGSLDFSSEDKIIFESLEGYKNKNRVFRLAGYISREDGRLDLIARAEEPGVEIDILTGMANIKIPVEGRSIFDLRVTGSLEEPQFESKIEIFGGKIKGVRFDSCQLSLIKGNHTLFVEDFRLYRRRGFELIGGAKLPFASKRDVGDEERVLDINISLSDGNLGVIGEMSPEIKEGKGVVIGGLYVKGTPEDPVLNGFLNVRNGELYGKQIFKKASNINGVIQLINNHFMLKELTGKIGTGEFVASGDMWYKKGEWRDIDFQLKTLGKKGIAIRIPKLPLPQGPIFSRLLPATPSFGEPKFDLHIEEKNEEIVIAGNIILEDTHFTYPPPQGKKTPSIEIDLSFLKKAQLDILLKTGENTWFENSYVDLKCSGDLRFTGPVEDFIVNGRMETIKGELAYLGTKYDIKEVVIEYIDDIPYLEARAETGVQRIEPGSEGLDSSSWVDDVIVLSINRARLADIRPTFSSLNYPNETSQQKAMNLGTTGIDTEQIKPAERELLLKKEVLKLVDSSLASPIIKGILKRSGIIDVVTVDIKPGQKSPSETTLGPEAEARENGVGSVLEGTRVTLGKYLGKKLFLGYNIELTESVGAQNRLELIHELEFFYRLGGRKFLKGRTSWDSDRGEKEQYLGIENRIRF